MRQFAIILLCGVIFWTCPPELKAQTATIPQDKKAVPLARLTFIYGDRPASVEACQPAWGLVILLEYDGRKILFNAGGDEKIFRHNMQTLQINPKELDAVVISHHHWEMWGGVDYLLKEKPSLPVYATDELAFLGKWQKNFEEVPMSKTISLSPNILVMKLKSPRFEGGPFGIQELHIIVKTKEGLVILQGCGHPKIVNIMENSIEASGEKRVYMIAGGTRLSKPGKTVKLPDGSMFSIPQRNNYTDDDYRQIADKLLAAGVKKIIPTHCTGPEAEAIFKQKFGPAYIHQTLGMTLDIPGPS